MRQGDNPETFSWYDYRWLNVSVAGEPLFTTSAETRNLATLDHSQFTGSAIDALGGNDTVTLPGTPAKWQAWGQPAVPDFHGGAGNDTITGGALADRIFGDADDDTLDGGKRNDILNGGIGNDTLRGGLGNDTFYIAKGDGIDRIEGGGLPLQKDLDTAVIAGRPTDFVIDESDPASIFMARVGNVDRITLDAEVEKIKFDGFGTNKVTFGNLYVEMARLSNEAYQPDGPNWLPTSPNGWRPVLAPELGLAFKDVTTTNVDYSMRNGVYVAAGVLGNASAHVYSGNVGLQKTLVVAFTGTDEATDGVDYLTFMNSHYARFKPLTDAIKAYVTEAGVDRVLVTGHSLGGAMAQLFMQETLGDLHYVGATFGSPGATAHAADSRMIHFTHSQDFVGFGIEHQVPGLDLAGEVIQIPLEPSLGSTPPGQLYGEDVIRPLTGEHQMDGYELRIQDLMAVPATQRPGTLNGTAHTPGSTISIVAGSNSNNTLAGDRFDPSAPRDLYDDTIFGRGGNDVLIGRAGEDHLWGGAGKDNFKYTSIVDSKPTAPDTILDFSHAQGDRVNLAEIDAKAATVGHEAFNFVGTGPLTATGQLHYRFVGGETRIEGDVGGDHRADFVILLDGRVTLSASDFILT